MRNLISPFPPDGNESAPFEALLRLLDQDRELAGQKYESLRRKLIKFFEWNFCFLAEDLADETFKRVEQKIGREDIRDVAAFAWGIAKNVRQEARKTIGRTIQISGLTEKEKSRADSDGVEKTVGEKLQRERRFECLQLCLERIPVNDRELFLAYHNVKGESLAYRKELAKRLGLTLGALRVKVNRLRNQLERCVGQCAAARRVNPRKIT